MPSKVTVPEIVYVSDIVKVPKANGEPAKAVSIA